MTGAVRQTPALLHEAYHPPPDLRMAGVAIHVDSLQKRFAARRSWQVALRSPRARAHVQALAGVSLSIPAGSCFGILGPNGAGKSTLFRILSTLVLPDAGTATICGLDAVQDAEAVRGVLSSAGADERSLFWRISAQENLRLYASLQGMRGATRSRRVEEALAIVGLEKMGGQLVGRFSSGLRQRLLLARALLGRPRVLLLDEPTRSQDPVAARAFREFLRLEIVQRQGCTVVIATHGADEAFDLCDRVAVLHAGQVVAQGRAAELTGALVADRVLMWTSEPDHPILARPERVMPGVLRLSDLSRPSDRTVGDVAGNWRALTFLVPGGAAGSAAWLARLVAAGVPVARLEPVRPSLADLLEELTGVGRSRSPGAVPLDVSVERADA